MERKLTIAVDLDSTLNNLNHVWIVRYNQMYDDTLNCFNEWNVVNCVKPECGNKIFDILGAKGFFYNLGMQSGADEVMEKLCTEHNVYIVTAYTADTCVDKVRWVQRYLPFFDIKNIVFCNNKSPFNADVLIDDAPLNLESFPNTTICFYMPYNNEVKSDYRAYSWSDINTIFNKTKKERSTYVAKNV